VWRTQAALEAERPGSIPGWGARPRSCSDGAVGDGG
jgi:hypothetical protein